MKENALKVFSENVLNKDIPLYTLKALIYLIGMDKKEVDIDEMCKEMYITKKKLTNELDKIKPIDSFLVVNKNEDGDYNLLLMEEDRITLRNKTKNTKKTKKQITNKSEDPVVIVFEFWKDVMGKTGRTTLDDKRRRVINTALQHLTIDEAKLAIIGCSKSPWHMGYNPSNKRYDSLELIFRDAKNIEGFIADASGLSLEERVKNEASSKPKNIDDRLNDNNWFEQRLKGFESNTSKEEDLLIEKKMQALLESKTTPVSCNYDVDKLCEISKKFIKKKEIKDDLIEDVEFSFVEENDNVPLYLKIAKNKQKKKD